MVLFLPAPNSLVILVSQEVGELSSQIDAARGRLMPRKKFAFGKKASKKVPFVDLGEDGIIKVLCEASTRNGSEITHGLAKVENMDSQRKSSRIKISSRMVEDEQIKGAQNQEAAPI